MRKILPFLLSLTLLLSCFAVPAFADDGVTTVSSYAEAVSLVREKFALRQSLVRFRYAQDDPGAPRLADVCADNADGRLGDYLRLSFRAFPAYERDPDGVYTACASFYTDGAQESAVDAYVSAAAERCAAAEPAEKARFIFDLLTSDVSFDLENLYNETDLLKYTAYGAVTDGKAVCQGFAQLYYRLAKSLGLGCRIVTGVRAGENHAWNLVRNGEYWYHVDASSGAQVLDPSGYFLSPGFDGYTIVYGDYTDRAIMNYDFAPEDAGSRYATGALTYLASWTLDKTTGLLRIDGTGDTGDFSFDPPFTDSDLIRTAVVSEGITRLGMHLFANCRSLEAVSIPASVTQVGSRVFENCISLSSITVDDHNALWHDDGNCLIETETKTLTAGCGASIIPADGSVTKIADRAFYRCAGLTDPAIPEGVTEIGFEAFAYCGALTQILFPDSLVTIGANAFAYCSGVTDLSIPAGVAQIGENAFFGCTGLTSIAVDPANPVYRGAGNCLIETDGGILLLGCGSSAIPTDGTIREIAPRAFENRAALTSVSIPAGVRTIGEAAFHGCTGLQSVSIPQSVTEIGREAFAGCTRLSAVTIPDGVKKIGDSAFDGCTLLTSVSVADSVTDIGNSAFGNTLWDLQTPDGVVYLGKTVYRYKGAMPDGAELALTPGTKAIADNAFENRRELAAVTVPEGVVRIGDSAFSGCSALTAASLPESLTSIGEMAFWHCDALASAPIPSGVTELGDSAFMYCDALTSAVIPSGVTVIEHGVFGNCHHLETLTLPEGLKVIDGEAFRECGALTALTIPETVERISFFAFYQCASLPRLTIPDSVTELGWNAFCDCAGLTSVTIGKGLAQVGVGAFSGTESLTEIAVDPGNPVYRSDGNCLIETSSGTLVRGCSGSVIPRDGSVTRVDYRAFFLNFTSIPVLSIPDSVTELANNYPTSGDTGNFPVNDYAPFFDHVETICGVPGSFAEFLAQEVGVPFVPACPATHEPHRAVPVVASAPDCVTGGFTAGEMCADCGEWLSGHEEAEPPLGHVPGETKRENVTGSTCETEGAYDAVTCCARCGEELSRTRERIALAPHADGDGDGLCDVCGRNICTHPDTRFAGVRAATCTESGYSGDTVCTVCGMTIEYGATVPASGHTPVIGTPAIPACCYEAGRTAEYVCAVCGDVTAQSRALARTPHTDADGNGACDVCFAPVDCGLCGRCGESLYWFIDNGVLVVSGSGASYDFGGASPWADLFDAFDWVYLREGVTAFDGSALDGSETLCKVLSPAGALVSDCEKPVLTYSVTGGAATLAGTAGIPRVSVYDLLNAAYILCLDRTVASLGFDRVALLAADGADAITYDILRDGRIVDEEHFTVPDGTEVSGFTASPTGYASFNDVLTALGNDPDRNLILSIACEDLLLPSMRRTPDAYTVQIVVRFVDDPDEPPPQEEPQGFFGAFVERFKATLAAILALFRKLFKLLTGK